MALCNLNFWFHPTVNLDIKFASESLVWVLVASSWVLSRSRSLRPAETELRVGSPGNLNPGPSPSPGQPVPVILSGR